MSTGTQTISAKEFDVRFDDGQDVSAFLDWDRAELHQPIITPVRKVSLSLPEWMIEALDTRAAHLGISRNAALNVLLADALKTAS